MKKSMLGAVCLALTLGLAVIGCGDDEDKEDDAVAVDAPGVDVNVKELGAAGSAAQPQSE